MARLKAQSSFRYPLSALLGNQGAVRVARELFRHGGPLSGPEIGARAGMTRSGVYMGLAPLTAAGLVRRIGGQRSGLFHVVTDHPLAVPLAALFDAEHGRVQQAYDAIRGAASGTSPRPDAVWLFGSVARGDDHAASDLDIAVVAANDRVEETVDAVREAVQAVGERLFLRISVIGVSPDDLDRMASAAEPFWTAVRRDAKTLAGPEPDDLLRAYRRKRRPESTDDGDAR
ncbi:MAG TPA: nucleotidyltransferase domain-containing protein [Longimicrobiaceae bacterium]|nr:nucleotidyltransferase domain-containing protein [Longimicrobiaceae bacterium]